MMEEFYLLLVKHRSMFLISLNHLFIKLSCKKKMMKNKEVPKNEVELNKNVTINST